MTHPSLGPEPAEKSPSIATEPSTGLWRFYGGTPLVATAEGHVRAAINVLVRKHRQEIGYAVELTVVPGEAPGQFVPVLIIVLSAAASPEAVRGYATSLSMDLHPSGPVVQEVVAGLLGQILGADQG